MPSARIFVSWSGERSHSLATGLKEWLLDVLHDVEVWVSSHDMQAGVRWSVDLSAILSECQFGIACVTPENQRSPWLLFEAGAISKSVENGRIVPLLLDLQTADLEYPLAQFQSVQANRQGALTVLEAINGLRPDRISSERLRKHFERWWPDLEKSIEGAKSIEINAIAQKQRTDREILMELVDAVRGITVAGPLTKLPHINLTIDSSGYFPEGIGKTRTVYVPSSITITPFLDLVWEILTEYGDIPPFRYDELWVLKNSRSGQVYSTKRNPDLSPELVGHLPLNELGIIDGDTLEVLSVKREHGMDSNHESPDTNANTSVIDGPFSLTPRQLEVLRQLAQGFSNKVITRNLSIAEGTLKIHIVQILRALRANSRLQAIDKARSLGILDNNDTD